MNTRTTALTLYKRLLKAAQQHTSYNIREYSNRRIKDAFRENKAVSDPEVIQRLLSEGFEQLRVLERQAALSRLYNFERIVVELDDQSFHNQAAHPRLT
jgi:hypothetical protein